MDMQGLSLSPVGGVLVGGVFLKGHLARDAARTPRAPGGPPIPASGKGMSSLRQSIPAPIKRYLKRTVVEPIRARTRDRRLRSCIRRLRAGDFTLGSLAETRRAWGNEGFSADLRYVDESTRLAQRCDGPILECGTGLTTLICGVVAEQRAIELWSFDQDKAWLDAVGHVLSANQLKPKLHFGPLRQVSDHAWYDIAGIHFPRRFGLVICDGPFVTPAWRTPIFENWRFGVVPALESAGSGFEVLLLDDADEPRASAVLRRWQAEFGLKHDLIRSPMGVYALVTT